MQRLAEALDAWCASRRPRVAGGSTNFVDFLLPVHISSPAVAMLLYYNDQPWVVAFAAAVAIGSKTIFRRRSGAGAGTFSTHRIWPSA